MKSVNQLCKWIREIGDADQEPNARGNQVYRVGHSSSRYIVDFADEFSAENWQQFDTDQDAEYFGTWVNAQSRIILTYCEGDWTVCDCPTVASYNAEIEKMLGYYGEGFIAKAIDRAGALTIYRQNRQQFFATV